MMPKPYQDARDVEQGLRARLESAEQERDEWRHQYELLESGHHQFTAHHYELRARLEGAEAALRRVHPDFLTILMTRYGRFLECRLCRQQAEKEEEICHADYCPFAALGAAGEKESRSDG